MTLSGFMESALRVKRRESIQMEEKNLIVVTLRKDAWE